MRMKAKLSSELASRFFLYVFRKNVGDEEEEDGEKGGRQGGKESSVYLKCVLTPKLPGSNEATGFCRGYT